MNRLRVTPNGYCLVPIGGRLHTVIGGPFDAYQGGFGVCLEKRSSKAGLAQLLLDVPDFGVPPAESLEDAVCIVVQQMLAHPEVPVFVGCMGGIGRTGMIIAALARACGIEDPVVWVRKNYLPSAVETTAQQRLVMTFDVSRAHEILAAHCRPPVVATTSSSPELPAFFARLRSFFTSLRKS